MQADMPYGAQFSEDHTNFGFFFFLVAKRAANFTSIEKY